MARQINLAALSASGDLTVSLENPFTGYDAIEDGNSNGVTSLFDGVGGQSDPKLVLNNQVSAPGGVPKECVVLNFNTPIKAQEVRIDNIIAVTTVYNIYINAGASDTDYAAKVVKSIPYSANPTLRSADLILPGGFLGTEIRNIVVELGTSYLNNDHILSEIELYIEKEAENPNFEFNDSVLETKAWNSSRYDGRQLEGAVANEFRAEDTTYGKTPVLRNYTRNIYIGNEIVGMTETAPEDPTLVQFPNFSYAQINSYITINDDLSITRNEFDPSDKNNSKKKAFYRPFVYDLTEGSSCNFIMGDLTVKNNLKSKYVIYYNGGQLKKLLQFKTHIGPHAASQVVTSTNNGGILYTNTLDSSTPDLITGSVGTNNTQTDLPTKIVGSAPALYFGCNSDFVDTFSPGVYVTSSAMSASLHNEDIYSNWFTGSLVSDISAVVQLGTVLDFGEVRKFSEGLLNYKNNSSYKGDKRFFVTLTPFLEDKYFPPGNTITGTPTDGGNAKPLYTFEAGSIHSGSAGVLTPELSTLTTLEIADFNTYKRTPGNGHIFEFVMNKKSKSYIDMHSNMSSADRVNPLRFGKGSVTNFESGSFIFSINDDDTPSILVPLKKERDLPSGKGDKPFIIVPDNLHPFIKDNLTYFLTRAGIDIGGNTSALISLNQKNRYPDRIGWKPPKPAPTPELQAAQDAKTEITFEQRRLLARQLAEQNRRRRLERLREEEENQRRNKRQSKREDRQEERKEKKQRREERKENRRENRQERREDRREDRQNRRENRRNRRRNR